MNKSKSGIVFSSSFVISPVSFGTSGIFGWLNLNSSIAHLSHSEKAITSWGIPASFKAKLAPPYPAKASNTLIFFFH